MQGVRGSSPRSSTNRDETPNPHPSPARRGVTCLRGPRDRDHRNRPDRDDDTRRGSSATTRPPSSRAGRRAGPSSGCTGRTCTTTTRRKFYLLTMYPYPSGDIHIGHWYIKTPTDAIARFHRMHGDNVFLPIGFDAFGLPAENAAIKNDINPRDWTMSNIDNMRRQLRTMGATFDWERRGRHRRSRLLPLEPVVLPAVPEGRPGLPRQVAGRLVPQRRDARPRAGRGRRPPLLAVRRARSRSATWTSGTCAVTKYADELLDFGGLEWPEPIKTQQTNWIGRSEGGEIVFDDAPRPSTSAGGDRAARVHDPPGHAVRGDVHGPRPRAPAGREADRSRPPGGGRGVRRQAATETEIERLSTDREKTGVRDRRRRHQPGQRRADPDLHRRLRPRRATGPARSWRSRRTTSATTRSPSGSGCRSGASSRRPARKPTHRSDEAYIAAHGR